MAEKEKFEIRQFKDKSSNWFLNNKHYHLNEQGEIVFIAGGKEDQTEVEALKAYCKRNKKVFKEREPSIFEREEIEYSKITFGKFSGMTTMEIVATDRGYAKWLYENSAEKKIKEELKQLLNIK
jgi:hypothetical protein